MNILVVGNVLKDVYLNLDNRTESFEVDKHNTKWLDISFDASEHHFFSREASLGGAAVTLEVLSKIGLKTTITGSNLTYSNEGLTTPETMVIKVDFEPPSLILFHPKATSYILTQTS